ncbi:hypothetical protein ACSBPQ_14620 [Stenotrophomonas sp. JC08]|uniref:hypothetical protein n=1 Tax=Stenotrophomonas sp. JC08 TaxID=3445779 RepID=UPI003FA2E938
MPVAHFQRHITSLSTNTIGTDALNALLRIPGVSNPEVVEESENRVTISYTWDAQATPPENSASHFQSFGLQKVEVAA